MSPAQDDHRRQERAADGTPSDQGRAVDAGVTERGPAPEWADEGPLTEGAWMTGSPPRVVDIERIRMTGAGGFDESVRVDEEAGPSAAAGLRPDAPEMGVPVRRQADERVDGGAQVASDPVLDGSAPAGAVGATGRPESLASSADPPPARNSWLARGRSLVRGNDSVVQAVAVDGRRSDGEDADGPESVASESPWPMVRVTGGHDAQAQAVAGDPAGASTGSAGNLGVPPGPSDGVFAPAVGRATGWDRGVAVAQSGRDRGDGEKISVGGSDRPSADAAGYPVTSAKPAVPVNPNGLPVPPVMGSTAEASPGGSMGARASGRSPRAWELSSEQRQFVDAVARAIPESSGAVGPDVGSVSDGGGPSEESGRIGVSSGPARGGDDRARDATRTEDRTVGRADVGNGRPWVRSELTCGTDPAGPTQSPVTGLGRASWVESPGAPTSGRFGIADGSGRSVEVEASPVGDEDPASHTGLAGALVLTKLAAVERLRAQVATLPLTLEVEDVADVRREREDLLSQLDDYILPRLQRPDAPALAVVGGSTGAGKSTLTNSIVGREVTRSGVLRPTTRSPVLVHHPSDSGAFLSQRILPGLARVTSEGPEPIQPIDPKAPRITGLRLVPYEGLPPGLALLDAPDIDSLVETNRDLAVQLLQAADLWIFVTTAARYADAMPWEMLQQAADRGVAIAVVLDRVPPEAMQELRIHLATKLRERGLGAAALFAVPEAELENGFLPLTSIRPLRDWLHRIAGNARSRSVVVERTLKGAVQSLPARARVLAKAAATQADGWSQLYQEIDDVFIPARGALLDQLTDGSLMTGQVLSHWQEFIARGDLATRLGGTGTSRVQRRAGTLSTSDQSGQPLSKTIGQAVSDSVHHAVRSAIEQTLGKWREYSYGASLLSARGHQVAPAEQEKLLAKTVDDWCRTVTGQVTAAREKAMHDRPDLSVDEGAVVDVVFALAMAADHRAASSPTSVGEDPDAAGVGTSTTGARLALEELLGESGVRAILDEARNDLLVRAGTVIDNERLRLERVLESPEHLGLRAGSLLDAASAVTAAE